MARAKLHTRHFPTQNVCVPKGLDSRDNGRVTAAWRGQNYTLATYQPKDVCVPKGVDNRDNESQLMKDKGQHSLESLEPARAFRLLPATISCMPVSTNDTHGPSIHVII